MVTGFAKNGFNITKCYSNYTPDNEYLFHIDCIVSDVQSSHFHIYNIPNA